MPISSPSRCLSSKPPPPLPPSTVPHPFPILSHVSEVLSLSPPSYQINSHRQRPCLQSEEQNQETERRTSPPVIQAAKLEIPCLGAVVFKFFLSLCCQTASSYFHFCYWGVRKQKYLMIRHLAPQSTHLSSLFETWHGLSLLRIFP